MYKNNAEGIAGMRYRGKNYTFVRDILGNVTKVMYLNMVIGEYRYDSWGNCTVININASGDDYTVLRDNPFRWKGYYYDTDTKCYYIDGRWYDPYIMQYLDADQAFFVKVTMF